MKLSYLVIIILAISLTKQNNFVRNQHNSNQNHDQTFKYSWAGSENSQCDQACKARNYNVCGTLKKQCCKQACKTKWFGKYIYCEENDTVQDLVCSVLSSISGGKYWKGTACDSSCIQAGGTVCGNNYKECCGNGCQKGTLTESCKDSNKITFNCAATTTN